MKKTDHIPGDQTAINSTSRRSQTKGIAQALISKGFLTLLHIEEDSDLAVIADLSVRLDPRIALTHVRDLASVPAGLEMKIPEAILIGLTPSCCPSTSIVEAIRSDPRLHARPIILMAKGLAPEAIQSFRACGVTAVIEKPFDPLTLTDDLVKLLLDIDQ